MLYPLRYAAPCEAVYTSSIPACLQYHPEASNTYYLRHLTVNSQPSSSMETDIGDRIV